MKKMKQIDENISSPEYQEFLAEIVNLVQNHRALAVQTVQTVSNLLYWNIGELIIQKQEQYGWGKSIVKQLSKDLNIYIGEGVSWSPRNLWFMRQLVDEYSKVKQPVSLLENLKRLVSEVPWGHNILILQKVKDIKARTFYLQTTIKNRYSRSVLLHQIEADAYANFLLHPPQHNFAIALPENMFEQTQESIKSVYLLDFLDINKPITEKQLETSMVEKVKRLMMELGYGFCFIGNQYLITLGEKEYFIDLLFYHRILKCLVAVELKVIEFEPEFIGKLDFYLQLIDEQLKQPDDRPSIGILLVPHKDRLEVEYALRTASKPIGVAKYTLSKKLPKELYGKLPSAKDFQKILTSKKDRLL
ncbi:MAG: PDDEXK nuclease domain-containing protein [Candidatus Methanoperedenaceae archaeon]|nr:PDDEXK nuclease domain-containing protein [Candidatus Methanoperedenaceae archaeon]